MPFCSSCGSELRGDVKFCASCGQPTAQVAVPEAQPATFAAAAAVAPQAAPEMPSSAAPVQPAAAPGYYPPPPPPPVSGPRRSLKWVWIGGGAAAAVIIAIVLVLVLVVFNGEDDDVAGVTTTLRSATTLVTEPGGSSQTSALPPTTVTSAAETGNNKGEAKEVEKVVRKFFEAMEDQDWGAFLDLMDPTLMGAIPDGEGRDAALAAIASSLKGLGKMKFDGLEFKVEITSPTAATVTLIAGKATITDAAGNETTEDVKDAGGSAAMEMKKVDGKWYIATSAFM